MFYLCIYRLPWQPPRGIRVKPPRSRLRIPNREKIRTDKSTTVGRQTRDR